MNILKIFIYITIEYQSESGLKVILNLEFGFIVVVNLFLFYLKKWTNVQIKHLTQARAEFVASLLMAEALALREVLITVRQHGSSNVWIRSDNLGLIRAINSNSFSVELFEVMRNIKFISMFFYFIIFSHVLRSCNGRAASLAKSAHLLGSPTLY